MNCPYCDNPHVRTQEDHDELTNQSVYTCFCVLCGWSRTVMDLIPTQAHLDMVRELRAKTWYTVVDKDGNRMSVWDFEEEDEALAMAEVLGGQVSTWDLNESWDGVTLPNSFREYVKQEEQDE